MFANSIPELQGIPAATVAQFRGGLRFANDGLAHADYSMLLEHLSEAGVAAVLNRFGIDEDKFELIKDTSCVDHVCFVHPGALCDPDRFHH